jgi:hypothetical protein
MVSPLKTVEELREGTSTKPGVFRVQAIRAHLCSKKHHGAGDLTGLQMREKMLVLFETDDEELHSLLFKHCMYKWVNSDLDLITKSRDPIAVLADLLKCDKEGNPNGEVRPIATGDAWSRLVASMLLASIADELGTWFLTQSINVRQYGVVVKDGLAQCNLSLCLCLESGASQQDPNNPFCALITYMSNAFNELK